MPYLPFLYDSKQYKTRVGDVSNELKYTYTLKSTLYDTLKIQLSDDKIFLDDFFPVVKDTESMKVVCSVRVLYMLDYFGEWVAKIKGKLEKRLRALINNEPEVSDNLLQVRKKTSNFKKIRNLCFMQTNKTNDWNRTTWILIQFLV